ncbi:MAG: hypothetical protein JXA44_06750 [Methanospirillaceae archaeon]|nr:hypothetical protein [Methanospirillaceae archaeon]
MEHLQENERLNKWIPDLRPFQLQFQISISGILSVKENLSASSGKAGELDRSARVEEALSVCLGDEIFSLEQTAAEQAVTLVKDRDGIIPVSFREDDSIIVFSPTEAFSSEFTLAFDDVLPPDTLRPTVITYTDRNNLTDEEKGMVGSASYVLLGTVSSNAGHRSEEYYIPRFSQDLRSYAEEAGVTVIGISLGQPYDIMYMQDIPVYLATYAGKTGGRNLIAAIRAISGEIPIQGTLPVAITDAEGRVLYPINHGLMRG